LKNENKRRQFPDGTQGARGEIHHNSSSAEGAESPRRQKPANEKRKTVSEADAESTNRETDKRDPATSNQEIRGPMEGRNAQKGGKIEKSKQWE